MHTHFPVPATVGDLAAVRRVLEDGAAGLVSAGGERVELPAQLQAVMRNAVRIMESGHAATLCPLCKELEKQETKRVLDELAREAFESGLYDRVVPFEHRKSTLARGRERLG